MEERRRNCLECGDVMTMVHSAYDRTDPALARDEAGETNFAADEEKILRCLGAAVIMHWNTPPTKLQRELFDKAGSMDEVWARRHLGGRSPAFFNSAKMTNIRSLGERPI